MLKTLSVLALFISIIAHAQGGGGTTNSADHSNNQIEIWNDEMISAMNSTGGKKFNRPPSLRNSSAINQFQNALFIQKASKYITIALAEQRNAGPGEDASNQAIRDKLLERVTKLSKSPLSFIYNGTFMQDFRNAVSNANGVDAKVFDQSLSLGEYSELYRKTIEEDRAKYGDKYFPSTVVAKGAVDVLGTAMHALIRGDNLRNWRAMFAIGLLHPITDSVVDRGELPRSTAEKAMKKIMGLQVKSETPFEKLCFDYLDYIEAAFPREQHVQLYWIIGELVKAQLASAAQKPTEEVAILKNAFRRGGLSTLAFMYIALGGLTPNELHSFYVSGGIYQLLDDLTDISADMQEGIPSFWTQTAKNEKNIKSALRKFMNLEESYEKTFSDSELLAERMSAGVHTRGFNILFMLGVLMNEKVPAVKASKAFAQKMLPLSFGAIRNGINAFEEMNEKMSLPDGAPRPSAAFAGNDGFNQMAEEGVLKALYSNLPNKLDNMTFAQRMDFMSPRLKGKLGRVLEIITRPFYVIADRGFELLSGGPRENWLFNMMPAMFLTITATKAFLGEKITQDGVVATASFSLIAGSFVSIFHMMLTQPNKKSSYWKLREQKRSMPLHEAIVGGLVGIGMTVCNHYYLGFFP